VDRGSTTSSKRGEKKKLTYPGEDGGRENSVPISRQHRGRKINQKRPLQFRFSRKGRHDARGGKQRRGKAEPVSLKKLTKREGEGELIAPGERKTQQEEGSCRPLVEKKKDLQTLLKEKKRSVAIQRVGRRQERGGSIFGRKSSSKEPVKQDRLGDLLRTPPKD